MPLFEARLALDHPAAAVFRWHARPGALRRLLPPFERVRILEEGAGIEVGARVVLLSYVGPLPRRWVARHTEYVEGRLFRDVQESGPFRKWDHIHRFEDAPGGGSILSDRIDYALPLGTAALLGGWARRKLERMFAFRHAVTRADLDLHRGVEPLSLRLEGEETPVREAVRAFLTTGGHAVDAAGGRSVLFRRDRILAGGRTLHHAPRPGRLEIETLLRELYPALLGSARRYSLPSDLRTAIGDA